MKPAPITVNVATEFVPYCTGVTAVTCTGVELARRVKLLLAVTASAYTSTYHVPASALAISRLCDAPAPLAPSS